MNKIKNYTLLALIIALVFSCKKEDSIASSSYIGTWVATETAIEDGYTMVLKDIMTFNENTFINTAQIQNPLTQEWINVIGMKGDLSVSNSIMTVTIREVGKTSTNPITQMPTGNIEYISENESGFDLLLEEADLEQKFDNEFSVVNNTLTLKTDLNNDGDYNDLYEITDYVRL